MTTARNAASTAIKRRRFLGAALQRVRRNQLLMTFDAMRKPGRSSEMPDRYQNQAETPPANTATRKYSHCSLDIYFSQQFRMRVAVIRCATPPPGLLSQRGARGT